MRPPVPHDLKTYDDNFDFEGNGFCPHQWEVSVPQNNCIIWSVLLYYLRSADLNAPGKFKERLDRLTKNPLDPDSVKTAILGFNPFFNIHKCFFDETLQKVSLSFKKLLDDIRPADIRKEARHDIQMISTLLKSNILIVDLEKKLLHLVRPSDGYCADAAAIILYYRESWSQDKKTLVAKRFSFSLDKDLCWELRSKAFKTLMKQLKTGLNSTEISCLADIKIESLSEKKEGKLNILIALLERDSIREIRELYDSPYTVSKLAEAGFQTDPRELDANKFSTFYYALKSSDANLVYLLFKYAANSCHDFENTVRDPNSCIISNFSDLKRILDDDCARSNNFENFGEKAEQARLKYRELRKFNNFLAEVSDGINKIREKIPKGSSMQAAIKQKEIILLILDTYDAFFFLESLNFNTSELEFTDNYTKHKTYYDNLDFMAALLFFDNIFLLKSVLKSPQPGLYSELESSFLLLALSNNYFTKKAIMNKIENLGFHSDSINVPIFHVLERLKLRENIRNFCRILRGTTLVEEKTLKRIECQEIIDVLSNFQDLKDEFLVLRLNRYLGISLETEPVNLRHKLAIQRALQELGESINVEKEVPSSIKYLLRECLPEDTLAILKKTRNTLSHLKSFQYPLKFEIEQDDDLFKSIQSEIRDIKEAFNEVFGIQIVRLMEFLINRRLEFVQNIPHIGSHLDPLVSSMELFREDLRKRSSGFMCMLEKKKEEIPSIMVPNINEFLQRLMGFASKSEEERVRNEIPTEVKSRVDAIKRLEQDLKEGILVDENKFDCLFLNKKDLASIKNIYKKYLNEQAESNKFPKSKFSLLHKIKKSPNPLNILDLILEKSKVSDSQLKLLFEAMNFSEKAETTLKSIIKISKNPYGDNVANLLKRIQHLQQVSIDEHYDICYLWNTVKSQKSKEFLAFKIVQRCFCDPSFRVSLEMLLFDCLAILKNFKEKNNIEENVRKSDDEKNNEDPLWLKTSCLFNGIDVRNVLAHGDPLVDSIGDMLDPKDLPSELVKKMLKLFKDRECIEDLHNLWQKAKAREKIVQCGLWKNYAKLLAEDPKDTTIYNDVFNFLEKQNDPKKKKSRNSEKI